MSKVLRRPLFRGGPVDPRGTGITSGLDDGRVRKQTGGDFFQKYILGPKFGGVMTPQQELMQNLYTLPPGASNVDRMKAMAELISEQQIGEPLQGDGIVPSYLTATPFYKTAYGDALEEVEGQLAGVPLGDSYEPKKQNNIDDIEGVAGEGNAAMQFDKDSLDAFEDMSIGAKVNAEIRAEDREKGNIINPKMPDETEISKDDLEAIFAEPLKKARRRDIGDILGGAAEGFLTGGLREGLIGATKAAKGPGRTEQIENAIASLKAQGKLLEGKEKRAFANEIKKLEKMKELGLGKTSQATNFTRALEITKNPDLYPPETVAAAKRQLGTYGSLTEGVQAVKKDLGTVAYGDFLNLVEMTEPEFSSANIIPADKVDQFLSQGLDDGVYVVEGEKRIIEIKNGKKVRDRSY